MFDCGYPYKCVGKSNITHKGQFYRHVYKFKSTKRHYLIWAEEHEYKTFVIKFFTQKSEKSAFKFNILIGDYDASRIIATCINVMIEVLEKNETASFAFIGAETFKNGESIEKDREISKRFSVYRKLMANKFGIINFNHIEIAEKNAYLMYNLKNKLNTHDRIIEKLTMRYPDLESN